MSRSGSFALEKNENLEAFLKALGVADDRIKMYVSATPTLDVNLDGTTLKMVTSFAGKTIENTLTAGKACPFQLASGAEFQVTMQAPAGNVAKGSFTAGGKSGDITVEFGNGELIEVFSFGGVTAKRIYKKK